MVQPEDIQELDTVEYAPAADRRRGNNQKGYRDLVRRLYFGVQFVIFSMEIQNDAIIPCPFVYSIMTEAGMGNSFGRNVGNTGKRRI